MRSQDLVKADLLESEIDTLQRRADRERAGMGCYYTTIAILKMRVQELREGK